MELFFFSQLNPSKHIHLVINSTAQEHSTVSSVARQESDTRRLMPKWNLFLHFPSVLKSGTKEGTHISVYL